MVAQRCSPCTRVYSRGHKETALTSWFNGCRNEWLSFSDSLHGFFYLLVGGIGLHPLIQIQSSRQGVQPASTSVNFISSLKHIHGASTAHHGGFMYSFLLGVHGLHELQEIGRKGLKQTSVLLSVWEDCSSTCVVNTTVTDPILTWGFMFGPCIPMAAICSMLGPPRPPNGVPPIWNMQTLH